MAHGIKGWYVDAEGNIEAMTVWRAPGDVTGENFVNYDVTDTEQFANQDVYHTVRMGVTFFKRRNEAAVASMSRLKEQMTKLADKAQSLSDSAERLVAEFPNEEGLFDA